MKIIKHLLVAEAGEHVTLLDTPNQSGAISPLYLIMHYTAGTSMDGAVSWLRNPAAKASAHLVIDRSGKVVQLVPFNRRAWHAGISKWGNLESMNQYSIGIELVNAGKLRLSNGQWLVESTLKPVPSAEVSLATHKNETKEVGWHEYTEVQIETASRIGALLHSVYGFTDVLGHDDVSPNRKVDPGPLFPMSSFRSIVLGRE